MAVAVLRSLFAAHGLPLEVVTDNGPQFRADECQSFLKAQGVKHTFTPPYHPQSNRAVERAVQTIKTALFKQLLDKEKGSARTLQHRLDNFLLCYRTTPHTFTGKTPAELFLRRQLRTRLSLVRPHLTKDMTEKVERVKQSADKRRAKPRYFGVGDRVLDRSVRGESVKWLREKLRE